MTVDLRLMRYVVAVAEEQGFHPAANRLHVAQAALSRQIRQLERELGVELFLRRPSTRLTEAGQVFVDAARRILGEVDRAVDRIRVVARGEVGTVRIGYTITAAFEALPRLLDKVCRDHPEIDVETAQRWDAELVTDVGTAASTSPSDTTSAPAPGRPRRCCATSTSSPSCRSSIRWLGGRASPCATCEVRRSACPAPAGAPLRRLRDRRHAAHR